LVVCEDNLVPRGLLSSWLIELDRDGCSFGAAVRGGIVGMQAESVKLSGTDVDHNAAIPVPVGVTPAWSDDQDIVEVEGHPVDAVLSQSSLECVDWPWTPGGGVVGKHANKAVGRCVHVLQDAASSY
jgi:hypothetical protein